jgi:hypothetical protein
MKADENLWPYLARSFLGKKKLGWKGMDWIHLALDRDKRETVVNLVMNLLSSTEFAKIYTKNCNTHFIPIFFIYWRFRDNCKKYGTARNAKQKIDGSIITWRQGNTTWLQLRQIYRLTFRFSVEGTDTEKLRNQVTITIICLVALYV